MKNIQSEFIGRGAIGAIKNILSENASKKIFLVTGKGSYKSCGAKADIEGFLHGYNFVKFDYFSPNPTLNEAMKGSKLFDKERCDFIIVIGGGSAIDIAKTINVFQAHPGQELELATGQINLTNALVPICVVPTTAGTGSEATHFAVIYVDGNKYSLASATMLPNYVILDSQYTDNLSPYITACTGFDALSQAIESYWALGATEESKAYAAQAIPLIINNIETAVSDSQSISCRDKMLLGANFAGKAINISKTTAPHALSYHISQMKNLPHGHAVAITLGNFFILHETLISSHDKVGDVRIVFDKLYSILNVPSAKSAQKWWYNLMKQCGLNSNLRSLELTADHVQDIVNSVNVERLNNHPLPLTKKQLLDVFVI